MIEDLFNEEIVAWIISDHPDEELCENTLDLLAAERNLEGAVFHTDQGSTYLSPKFKGKIKSLGMKQSCSARGVCWDNAAMESTNGVINTECLYNKFGKSKFKNRQIQIDDVVAEIALLLNITTMKDRNSLWEDYHRCSFGNRIRKGHI